ncbi:MAG TPA: dihydrolipoamide acetyltransferase family protein [Gammaproteobacteria bacterium]
MNILMPQLGETVAEGTVAAWHKKVGDTVVKDEILLDVETDKAATEVPAPEDGVITAIHVQEGETVEVGVVLAVINGPEGGSADAPTDTIKPDLAAAEAEAAKPVAEASRPAAVAAPRAVKNAEPGQRLKLSPVVRRLIAEHGLDAYQIAGSGRDGRITRADVLAHIEVGGEDQASAPRRVAPIVKDGERIPFDRIRRLTAEHMVRSKATSPHVLQAVEVDFSGVESVRSSLKDAWKRDNGFSLTYLPFIARATCMAIREFPRINASVDDASLVLHRSVHLSVAVALGLEGLVAPVIRDAQDLTVSGLARRISEISARARDKKLSADDLTGGTYTLTNNGSYGTLMTAPIINQPQVAILSVDAIKKRPVVIEGPDGDSIGIRPIGILSQSFDHRAIDGAYSAAFLDRIRSLLEQRDWSAEF